MNRRDFSHANNPSFDCAESVILLPFGRESYLPAIADAYGGELLELSDTTDRIVYRLTSPSVPVTLVYSGMGAPAAANALEMIAAAGTRRIVVFGACGGVAAHVGVGDLVVASGAVRGEGTSRYYAPSTFPALFDPLLTSRLWEGAADVESPAHLGVVFTTDAGYRQGPEIYQDCAGLVIGVENECASVAVVASRLGLSAGALLFCTDNVILRSDDDRAYRGLSDPRVRRGFESGLEIVIEALSSPLDQFNRGI